MKYRTWTHAGTALLLAVTPNLSAFAQGIGSTRPTSQAVPVPATVSAPIVPVLDAAAQSALQRAISNSQRIEPSRDRWRNPAATLQFFGVRPTDTVIEVWPGGGWYTSILGPYLKQGGGSLIVGHFDAASTDSSVVRQMVDAYGARFASNQGTYGSVSVVPFGPLSGALGAPGSADSVLTFRNIHNWMAQNWAEKAFGDFFLVLKPGGILGIEEHRGRTDEPQDPLARDGYVREDFVIQLAREAGFDFIGRSEINANPADTKDHPFGVWTLPPVSRTSALRQRDDPGFDRVRYDAIGESDRMTLRFRKPLSATGAPPSAGTRWVPVIVAPAPPAPTPRPKPTPPVIRVVRPPIVGAPVVVAPVIVAPVVVPPAGAPAIVTARPSPGSSSVTPPIGPTGRSSPAINAEAAAPRAVEPTPKPKPSIVSPAPVVLPPIIAAPVIAAPVIAAPSIAAPSIAAPVIPAPVIPAPVSQPSVLSPPVVPTTVVLAPVVPAPVVPAPVVPAPVVPAPVVPAPVVATPITPTPILSPRPIAPSPVVDPTIIAKPLEPIAAPAVSSSPTITPDPSPPTLPIPNKPSPAVPEIVDPPVKATVTLEPSVAPSRPPVLAPLPRTTPAQSPSPKPVTAPPNPPPPARSSPPAVARPAPLPTPPPTAVRPAPRLKAAAPEVAPAPRPAAARPAVARPAAAPIPKAKAKAPPPPARPVIRPAPPPPVAKKKATPPPVDPNKPDWVVPRRRS